MGGALLCVLVGFLGVWPTEEAISPCAAPLPHARQVLKLPRSGGVVVRSRELRQAARKVRVEEYFYGNRKVGWKGAQPRGCSAAQGAV